MSGAPGPTTALAPALRALGLSGMLDTLDARLAEARAGTLGHVEFLEVLCQDELARRDAQRVARRVKAAHFDTEATIEGFDFAYNPALPVATIRDLARLDFIDGGEGVIIYGPVGVGKSHLAQALGHAACRRGHEVLFAKTTQILADLAGGHAAAASSPACDAWPSRPCSSPTTSPCESSPRAPPTTSTSCSAPAWDGRDGP